MNVPGFSWTAALFGLLNLLIGGALVAWIRQRPQMRQLETGSEEKLRADLLARVETLERRLDEERAARQKDEEQARQAADELRRQHERITAIMRHRLNNSDQCIDALLLLLETAPDRVAEAVARIKELRSTQRVAEAVEKAEYHADNIAAARPLAAQP